MRRKNSPKLFFPSTPSLR